MYDVLDISKYIIKECNRKYKGINYLKLNCLLYFLQIVFIKNKNVPCFKEDIITTSYGIKIEEVSHEYRCNGFSPILYDNNWNMFCNIEFDENIIKNDDKNIIDAIIDRYADCILGDLFNKIKTQYLWHKVYYSPFKQDQIITVDDIRRYI